ncbi:hypothetical protein JOC78_002161 [Bacillus ectoiniformans]|uniref:hypothetical protein n=1 Tax=Bacillus ectoiniformans TaxID=1494429 RepID=UPI0019577982|nr:hypothetical protein [Bacillus ectoiniformans]MBM7649208.1 hypothetical protein [Bacillus ectoiniformans]
MPISVNQLKVPDEHIMNQDEVVDITAQFLRRKGWKLQETMSVSDPDLVAEKDGWHIVVKAKGSQSRRQKKSTVFDNSQLRTHAADQIEKMMRFQQTAIAPTLFIMANPDIYRIKSMMSQISLSLDKLELIRLWATPEGEVELDIPENLYTIAKRLDL